MAKVTGPLLSFDASGAIGGSMVFSKWKGRNTVRQLVTPSNPNSAGQEDARNAVRILAAGQHWANYTTLTRAGETLTDKGELITRAPAGQAWNGYLVRSGIGAGSVNFTAAAALWAAFTGPEKTAWDVAADALVPAMPSVNQTVAGGGAGTPTTSGQTFLHYCYGLYISGTMPAAPTAVPPVYS